MSDIKEQIMDNLIKHEFRRGVRVGVDKVCEMFRLVPKEHWEQVLNFLENEENDPATWAAVDAIIEGDKVIGAEIIE